MPAYGLEAKFGQPQPSTGGVAATGLLEAINGIMQTAREARAAKKQEQLSAEDRAWMQEQRNQQRKQWGAKAEDPTMVDLGFLDPQFAGRKAASKDALEYWALKKGLKNGGGVNVNLGQTLTPGQKAADTAYGRTYQEWVSGGRTGAQKGLNALRAAQSRIYGDQGKPREDLSGTWKAALPEAVKPFVAPEMEAVKQDIQSAVNQTLRATLGAQFTEQEGKRIFAQSWDDKLPVQENIAKLDRLISQMQDQVDTQERQARYFEDQGSLRGFRFENGGQAIAPAAGPKPGDIDSGYRFKGGDPSNPASWEPVR